MLAQRFGAHIDSGPRGRGVIAIPFDPDEVWGAKAEHPVGGTIDGRPVRGTITPDGGGWVFMSIESHDGICRRLAGWFDCRCGLALSLTLALLLPSVASAQRYAFKYYGHDQGLTNLAIMCLLQDRMGFIWVGTHDGLFRYDGLHFAVFRKEEGLPSSRIESLHQTSDGTLWAGTAEGLAREAEQRAHG